MTHQTYTLNQGSESYKINRKEFCEIYKPVRDGLVLLETYINEKHLERLDGGNTDMDSEIKLLEHSLKKYADLLSVKKNERIVAKANALLARQQEERRLRWEREDEEERIRERQVAQFNLGLLKFIPEIFLEIIKSYLSAPIREKEYRRLPFDPSLGTDDYQYEEYWIEKPNKYWNKIKETAFKHTWRNKYHTAATIALTKLVVKDLKHIGNKYFNIPIAINKKVRNRQEWLDAILVEMAEPTISYVNMRKTMLTILLAGKQFDKQKGKGLVFNN